jgi:hypothetical protein
MESVLSANGLQTEGWVRLYKQNTHIRPVELGVFLRVHNNPTRVPLKFSTEIYPGPGSTVAMPKPKRLVSENGAAGDQTLRISESLNVTLHLPPPEPVQVLLLTAYNTTPLSMHAPLNKMGSGPGQHVSGELPGISGECLRVR